MNAKMNTQLVAIFLLTCGVAMAQRGRDENQQQPSGTDFVTRLDKDNDSKVSSDEFDGPAEHFTQLDKNSDGYISADEAPTGPPPQGEQQGGQQQGGRQQDQQAQQRGGEGQQDSAGFVTRLDKDGDGKVSSSEFDGPSNIFTELDKNSDGYLSTDEAPSGPPPRGGRQ